MILGPSIEECSKTGQSHLIHLVQNTQKILVVPSIFEALGMDANTRRTFLTQQIQADMARTSQIAVSPVQLWTKPYREEGLAAMANNITRSNKGKSRMMEDAKTQLVEGLALQKPPYLRAAIHRQFLPLC